MEREKMTADPGCVYTNGTDFGAVVYLKQEDDAQNWYQVSAQDMEPAGEADYRAALEELGVKL